MRGTVAVERGPLVYCFEQADQPAGTDVEDVALALGVLRERPATLPGVGPTVLIDVVGLRQPAHAGAGPPYRQEPEDAHPAPEPARYQVTTTAIPYFQWDNRDGQAMRVWLPLA